MQNKYTLSYVFQIISESEFEFSEDIIKFGMESWPITRNMLWTTLTNLKKENKIKKEIKRFKLNIIKLNIKRYKNLIKRFFGNINYKFSVEKFHSEYKTIFFSRGVYLEKIGSGMLIDRVMDPIYMTSSINEKSLKIYLDNLFLKDIFFLKGFNYYTNKSFLKSKYDKQEYKNLEKYCIEFLKSFIKLNLLYDYEEFLIDELKKSIKTYLISKKESKTFLKNFDSLKKIFLPSWYFPDTMGIIAAAKELNITTVEVQHGKQGEFQAAYSGWNFFPDRGFLNMPDQFWCWGNKSVKNILRTSPKRKFHNPILGGYAWPIWYKTFAGSNQEKGETTTKIKLLFTIQGAQGDTNNEPLPDGLFDLISYYQNKYTDTNEKIFELKIRLHPNCVNKNLRYLKSRLGKFFNSDLITYTSKLTHCFYDDLCWSNHHLTYFSSCAIEALLFGIKSAVYGNESYKIYKEEIENKSITFLKYNSLEEILNWIDHKPNLSSESYKDIVEVKFPDQNLIRSI